MRSLLLALAAAAGLAPACSKHSSVQGQEATPQPEVVARSGRSASVPTPSVVRGEPVAVVELFTSEGCSSCPPADENLASLAEKAKTAGRRVYALSFHVDYWNYLGWKDPFSDAAYSERQRGYASAFASRRVYTPQMIVNGSVEFVGSDGAAAARAVDRALENKTLATIELNLEPRGRSELEVRYGVRGASQGASLNLAVVQSAEGIRVARGENAGRTLSHENVVRAFGSVRLSDSPNPTGRWSTKLPPTVSADAVTVVGYVQRRADMKVVGATAARAPSSG